MIKSTNQFNLKQFSSNGDRLLQNKTNMHGAALHKVQVAFAGLENMSFFYSLMKKPLP
jgi:hypothetical protein